MVQSRYDISLIMKKGPHHADGGPIIRGLISEVRENLHITQLDVWEILSEEEPTHHPTESMDEYLTWVSPMAPTKR